MKPSFIAVMLLCVTLVGCNENNTLVPIIEPPVASVQPKVELTISTSVVEVLPYGKEVTVSWISQDSKYCVLNAETVQTTGSVKVKLFADTKYLIKAINGNLSATAEKVIKVGDWTTSTFGMLTYEKPWMLKNLRYRQNGVIVSDPLLSDVQKSDLYYYDKDENFNAFHSNGVIFSSGKWSLQDETHMIVGDKTFQIEVSPNSYIRSIESLYNGKPAVYEVVYYRPEIN